MTEQTFKIGISLAALAFLAVFLLIPLPAAMALEGNFFVNLVQAFQGGFVNPFATGYAIDAIACWFILIFWVLYEARTEQIRYGWICIILGALPGIAVGFATYLLLRQQQLRSRA